MSITAHDKDSSYLQPNVTQRSSSDEIRSIDAKVDSLMRQLKDVQSYWKSVITEIFAIFFVGIYFPYASLVDSFAISLVVSVAAVIFLF